MGKQQLNCLGMRCPQPVLKMALLARKLPTGTLLEVLADCPAFPTDVRKWCGKHGKVLLRCTPGSRGRFLAQVQF